MGKPSNKTAEHKAQVVVSVLRGELTAVEAARLEGVSEQSIHNWKAVFLEAGRAGLSARGTPRRSTRESELEATIGRLTEALAETEVQLRTFQRGVDALPPSSTSR